MIKLEMIFTELNRKRIRYMVAGGVAVNLYGVERATADIDLIVDLKESNLHRFISVMKKLNFKPSTPTAIEEFADKEKREKWIKLKGMKAFCLRDPKNPFMELDILTEIPFDFDAAYNIRRKMKSGNVTIPVVPIKYLIQMKKITGRPQDRSDVHYLKKIEKEWMDDA